MAPNISHLRDEEVVLSVLLVPPRRPRRVRDGVRVLLLVRRDQAVLDVPPTHAVRAQQHQRLPLVRRQLHHL